MARVRVLEKCELASWDDVNLTLAEIGEQQRAITEIETQMQKSIDDAKLAADMAADPHMKRIERLENQVKLFVEDHAHEMGGKKTMTLTFGQCGYRKSTKVTLPKAAAKIAEIIKALKARGMGDCVVAPPEKIDKEALKKHTASDIVAAGAGLKVEDIFWYEVDKAKLEARAE
jgi:phage host-nuclease inhibitor protein Gam